MAADVPAPAATNALSRNQQDAKKLTELRHREQKILDEINRLDERMTDLGRTAREGREQAIATDPELLRLQQEIAARQTELERKLRDKNQALDKELGQQTKLVEQYQKLRDELAEVRKAESGIMQLHSKP